MLFDSSIRKELGRSFGATLVVLITVVMTMMLIRTLGQATKGTVSPSDVMLVMGFTGKKALAWKIRYIQAFNAMAEKLSDLCYRERLAQYAGQFEAARKLLGDEMCARINEVLMMRDVKIPVKQIARLSGVSTSTVSRWTKKYGWLERPLSLNCYLSGITLYEVERRRSVQQGSLLTLTGRA